MAALAALVPWAEAGIRQIRRWSSPRLAWKAWMASRPASSPWDPALGCTDTAS